ncbi:MAG: hypothetical protein DMD85_00740 [Candidatus Rokuibacteriota bacterium]|nr:MAG: hypothetical protein DMD85_00740 [Candidatus Rokubacteria bacterium]
MDRGAARACRRHRGGGARGAHAARDVAAGRVCEVATALRIGDGGGDADACAGARRSGAGRACGRAARDAGARLVVHRPRGRAIGRARAVGGAAEPPGRLRSDQGRARSVHRGAHRRARAPARRPPALGAAAGRDGLRLRRHRSHRRGGHRARHRGGVGRRGRRDHPPAVRHRAGPARARDRGRSRCRPTQRRRREPQALITDVPGVRVGHATDAAGLTGVTVVLCDRPAVAGVELRGGANDVLGLDYLDARHLVPTVQGVLLGGGSRFGGEAVWGVMRWLEERGAGFAVGPTVIPHVPAAFVFDLNVGDPKARPTREMGYAAAAAAAPGTVTEGSVGAGTGASVGKLFGVARAMRGGLGTASARVGDAIVGALVVVNAVGDVREPETGALIAGTRDAPTGRRLIDTAGALREGGGALGRFGGPEHTTIGVVATNARLGKPEAAKLAALGLVGFARALSPPHTAFDGDTLFALSAGDVTADLTRLGLAAADAVARAITRAVRAATSLPGLPAASQL